MWPLKIVIGMPILTAARHAGAEIPLFAVGSPTFLSGRVRHRDTV
jgi:hypothetical protein